MKPSFWIEPMDGQSLAGYLRQHIDTIDARLAAGVRQRTIVDELKNLGYFTTVLSLRNALMRSRRAVKQREEYQGADSRAVERRGSSPSLYAGAGLDEQTKHCPLATVDVPHRDAQGPTVVLPPAAVPGPRLPVLSRQYGFRFNGTKDLSLEDLV